MALMVDNNGNPIGNTAVYGIVRPVGYSLEEQDTGMTWIDGKKIYQKTFVVDDPANNTEVDIDVNIDTFVSLFGIIIGNDNAIIDISTYFNSSYNVAVQYLVNRNKLNFQINYSGGLSKAYVTIQYTKTTD